MELSRRQFCALVAGGASAGAWSSVPRGWAGEVASRSTIKAIAFDAFVIFDPWPLVDLAEQLFPGKGEVLSSQWRTRQFEYAWLRVSARRYVDFWQVTGEALDFAAEEAKVELTREKRDLLMNASLELDTWPDVMSALRSLSKSGFCLALLSNLTPAMLAANVTHAGLTGVFEQTLSTDQVKTYKPDPRAYQLGIDALRLKREEILFVAFGGWDAAGAKSFGYPTFWLNRLNLPAERLGFEPDATGKTLDDLTVYMASKKEAAAPIPITGQSPTSVNTSQMKNDDMPVPGRVPPKTLGMTTVGSHFEPKETMDRLEAEIRKRGTHVFIRIDHAAGAAEAGLELRPTELIVFGTAKAGTLLMHANQMAGIDLPLKALVWQDAAEQTWVTYTEPEAIAQRHELGGETKPTIARMAAMLADVVHGAVNA